MEENTYRDENDTDRSEAYWRRRAITLAAGLGLLALLAWAFSGGGGGPAPASPIPSGSRPSGLEPAAAFSGPATPSPAAGLAGPTVSASPAAPSPSPASPSPSASPQPQAAGPGGRCSPKALVLSLFTDRPSYNRGQDPGFQVYAVSTAPGRCVLDLGRLEVVITSAGRVIWESADCARGQPGGMAELSRGVPVHETIGWNRAITLPGCVTLASARAGAYQVQARIASGGAVSSPVRTFRLAHGALGRPTHGASRPPPDGALRPPAAPGLRARSRARWPAPHGCLRPR